MDAPLRSILSLISELLVSASIFYVFYKGYKKGIFSTKLAAVTLVYDLLFIIYFLATRTSSASKTVGPAVFLAIAHGVLSVLMPSLLVILFIVAWKKYKKGKNFFKDHKFITWIFIFFWIVSVLSGFSFFVIKYVIN